MSEIPWYIPLLFILTALCSGFLFLKAMGFHKPTVIFVGSWLFFQAILGYSGFYENYNTIPPRLFLAIVPALILLVILCVTEGGNKWMEKFDLKKLTLLHLVRIPVEIILYGLFSYQLLPELMTFTGRNFDILAGLSVPICYYFGCVRTSWTTKIILLWNMIGLFLLLNIIANAILSAPFSFQCFGFEQPNRAIFFFPYTLLPAFIVPLVLCAHAIAIKRLLVGKVKI